MKSAKQPRVVLSESRSSCAAHGTRRRGRTQRSAAEGKAFPFVYGNYGGFDWLNHRVR